MLQANDIVALIKKAMGDNPYSLRNPIQLHEPFIGESEKQHVLKCLEDGWTSTAGEYVTLFEDRLAKICDVEHVVACINGTAALHIAMLLAGVNPGDEVIIPGISFIATANAVLYLNAHPHFVDVSRQDYGIDVEALENHLNDCAIYKNNAFHNKHTGRRLAALLPVHCFGYACDITGLIDIARKYKLPLIEDSTEALGTTIDGVCAGGFGIFGTLSFNGNKIITTGGGGAILTNDKILSEKARHLTTTAKVSHPWKYHHDMLGYNYRLPSLNAAMGIGQLEKLQMILAKKKRIHENYCEIFSDVEGVNLLESREKSISNHWLNTLKIPNHIDVNELVKISRDEGINLRPVWELLNEQPYLNGYFKADMNNSIELVQSTVSLPSSPQLANAI